MRVKWSSRRIKWSIISFVLLVLYYMSATTKHVNVGTKTTTTALPVFINLERIRGESDELFNFNLTSTDNIQNPDLYLQPYSVTRLNNLFEILQRKEDQYGDILRKNGLLVFNDLVKLKNQNEMQQDMSLYNKYKNQIDTLLDVQNNRVTAKESFLSHLQDMSYFYSFKHPRENVAPRSLSVNNRPVIVTAANTGFYGSLQATLFHIHQHFPGHDIMVFDLGLTTSELEITQKYCKCSIKKFDADGEYSKLSPHTSDLHTYAWKPLIILEAFKTHDLVIYMDSSIRIKSGQIEPILDTVKTTGLLTQFIGLSFKCYTNPKIFTWFNETVDLYENMWTIEANFMIMYKNFINLLLMKAWVTCALDKTCIAPEGSNIGGCCGCHRFDQSALTIVSTYFYGHPKKYTEHLPAHSLTKNESYFFSVERYTQMNYFGV